MILMFCIFIRLICLKLTYEGCSLISAIGLITFTVSALWQCARYIRWKLDLFPLHRDQTLWYIIQGCLETLLSNTAQQYHLTVFLQLSNMHFWSCFAKNYISVIVQAENVLNAGLHLFQIQDIEFPLWRLWFVNMRQIQSMQKQHLW